MPLEDIVRKKGMAEILVELKEGHRTFTEIMNVVRLSMNTILARLRESEAYDLLKRVVETNNGRIKITYALTKKGRDITSKLMENEAISKLTSQCRSLKRKTNEVEKELDGLLNEVKLEF